MSIVTIRFAAHRLDALQRSPLIERLLARAAAPVRMADWRADAFTAIAPAGAPMPPVASAALAAAARPPAGAWVCIATPVHLRAGMTSIMMSADSILRLEPQEALQFAGEFNREFAGAGLCLGVGREDVLLCVFDRVLEVRTHDPDGMTARDLFDVQPAGADGPRLRQAMSEIEMWLFDHAFNRARAARSCAPVTGLWLWGGGEPIAALPPVRGWTAGRDPFFAAFCRVPDWPADAAPGALEAGRLRRLDLSAADRRCSVPKGPSWRFWRRARPWWEPYGAH